MYATNQFRKGLKIEIEGIPYEIVDFQHVSPGKGRAFTRTKLRNMLNQNVTEKTITSGDKVDRANTEQAKAALGPVVDTLREGTSVIIAPEGTRSLTPEIGRFKKGAFHIAMQAGVPIVPVVIRNAGEVLWKHSTVLRPGTVDVVVLDPIDVSDWTLDELGARVAEVEDLYRKTLANWPA